MLRWTIAFLLASVAIGPAVATDEAPARRGAHRAAGKLPAGLPRLHYNFRTTIARDAPYKSRRYYARPPQADDTADLLFTPMDGMVRSIRPWFSGPLLPGSSALPGYYGSSHSYEYQGPYYGGPNLGYWNRLPYACGVYGYC